jgi:Glycosyltransferase like family 2
MTDPRMDRPATSSAPRITVVVRAFRRREFLSAALDSVERQRLPTSDVETIVLTPPPRGEWSAELSGRNVVHLVAPGPLQGRGLAEAAHVARAPWVALLDDDDRFHPDRLGEALERLEHHPEVEYYRSGLTPFRSDLEADARSGRPPETPFRRARTGLRSPAALDAREAARLFWGGWAYCSSTVIVRRELLLAFPDALEQLYVGASMFLFWSAIARRRPMFLEPRGLTLYRVHGENVSGAGEVRERSTWRRWQRLAPTLIHEAGVLRSVTRTLPDPERWTRPIAAVEARNRLLLAADRPDASRGEVLRYLSRYVTAAPPEVLASQWGFLAVGMARLVSPRVASEAVRFWFGPAPPAERERPGDDFEGAAPPED